MNEDTMFFIKMVTSIVLVPVCIVLFMFNFVIVLNNRQSACDMTTLAHYFPSNWISCELTKSRFKENDR